MPKLIILGTNDQYWSQDALNLYWNGLAGPKWVTYTPNSGHGLEDGPHMFATLAAFTRTLAAGKAMPKPAWRWETAPTGATLTISSDKQITSARLFRAESATKDFRNSHWSSTPVEVTKAKYRVSVEAPTTGYAAVFGEVTYDHDGNPFTLSTQIRILGGKP